MTPEERQVLSQKLRQKIRTKEVSRSATREVPPKGELKGTQQNALLDFAADDPEKMKLATMVLKDPKALASLMGEVARYEEEEEEAPPRRD